MSDRPGFDLVVFDLDGTLIDAFDDIASAANFIRNRNGLTPLTQDEVKVHVGHGARHLVMGVLATEDDVVTDDNLRALVAYYENLKESTATIYDGVLDTLQTLRDAGVKTAVASNKPHSVSLKVVEHLRLTPYFDIVRGEGPDITRKPAPDVLNWIMVNAGVLPERTLMVGDSDVDIHCAQAAGVSVAAVTYGAHHEKRLREENPDFVIHSMGELLGCVMA